MSLGQSLADSHPQCPEILGAQVGIIDPASVLGATGLTRLACAVKVQPCANLSTNGFTR